MLAKTKARMMTSVFRSFMLVTAAPCTNNRGRDIKDNKSVLIKISLLYYNTNIADHCQSSVKIMVLIKYIHINNSKQNPLD